MAQARVFDKTIKQLNEIVEKRKKNDNYVNTQKAIIAEAVEVIYVREVKK